MVKSLNANQIDKTIKRCSKCKIEKNISEFYECNQWICKNCLNERSRIWQKENPETAKKWKKKNSKKVKKYDKKYSDNNREKRRANTKRCEINRRRENRKWLLTHLGIEKISCEKCGYSEVPRSRAAGHPIL